MNIAEFEAIRLTAACGRCGHVGLGTEYNRNNNGIRPICPECGSGQPIPGVMWLGQDKQRRLKRPPGDPAGPDVWAWNGEHCAFCGITRAEAETLGLGLTAQHVVPYACTHCPEAVESPLVPFCSRCQEASAASTKKTEAWRRGYETLRQQIERIRSSVEHEDA